MESRHCEFPIWIPIGVVAVHDMGASGGTGGVLARLLQMVSGVDSECDQNTGASQRIGVYGAAVVAAGSCSLFD
jgi:hypothetical protein